jgi:hypothetical protein
MSRSRKAVALTVSAALLNGILPLPFIAAVAASAADPAQTPQQLKEARALFQESGISDDAINRYLFEGGKLSAVGQLLYRPMKERYAGDGNALREEGKRLNDKFEAMKKAPLSQETVAGIQRQLGKIDSAYDPDNPNDNFQRGARIEALMSGTPDPKNRGKGEFGVVHQDNGGAIVYDAKGIATIMSAKNVVEYNRALQEQQKLWNHMDGRPADAPMIPETGRTNRETIEFGYYYLKSQVDARFDLLRASRMRLLGQLLGEDQVLPDMYTDALERKWEKEAAKKKYSHGGGSMTILEYVDNSMREEKEVLNDAFIALTAYRRHLDEILYQFSKNPQIQDSQRKIQQEDQAKVGKLLGDAGLTSYLGRLNTLRNYLDPSQPEFSGYKTVIEHSGMSDARQKTLQETLGGPVKELQNEMAQALLAAREVVRNSKTTPESQKVMNAALAAADHEFQKFDADMMVYHNTFARAQVLHELQNVGWFKRTFRQGWGLISGEDSEYVHNMRANKADWTHLTKVMDHLADGDLRGAKSLIIDMHPQAAIKTNTTSLDPANITDAQRIDSSFRALSENIGAVKRTNTYVDAAATIVEFSTYLAVGGGAIRGALMLGAKVFGGIGGVGEGIATAASRIQSWPARLAGLGWLGRAAGGIIEWAGTSLQAIAGHLGANIGIAEASANVGIRATWAGRIVASMPAHMMRMTMGFAGVYGVMGAFGVGQHYYKENLQDSLPEFLRGSESPFSSAGAAFRANAEGNLGFFSSGFMPLIFFAGVPLSVFTKIPIPGVPWMSKLLANNGIIGVFSETIKGATRLALSTGSKFFGIAGMKSFGGWLKAKALSPGLMSAEEIAERKLPTKSMYEKIDGVRYIGKPAAFIYGNADGLGRFFAMNFVVERAGWNWGYYLGRWSKEEDFGQRLKGAHATENAFAQSYWWAFLPQHSAQDRAQNEDVYRAYAGVRALEKEGRLSDVMNADEGATLFYQRSLWQRISNPGGGDSFQVNSMIKDYARLKVLAEAIGGKGVKPEKVHFMDYYEASLLDDKLGAWKDMKVDAALRSSAVSGMVNSLLDHPTEAAKFLDEAAVGTKIGEYRVRLEVQEALAFALLGATNLVGRTPSRSLRKAAQRVLKRYVDSSHEMAEPVAKIIDAVSAAKGHGDALAPSVAEFQKGVTDGLEKVGSAGIDRKAARELLEGAIAKLKAAGPVDAKTVAVLEAVVGYVDGNYRRFDYANNVKQVSERVSRVLDGLGNEYGSHPAAGGVVTRWRELAREWRSRHNDGDPADVTLRDDSNPFKTLTAGLEKILGEEKSLSVDEQASLNNALKEMKGSAWVVRDDKSSNMTGWRAEQLKGLVDILTGYALQSAEGKGASRMYDLIPTGGGKTLTQFIGLLPLIEEIANRRGLTRLVYATIPPLKAQAMNDFFAFRVTGTRLEFRTPEDLKAEIAQGKIDHRDPASKTMLIGDEADKFLFEDPQTSLGGRAGIITRVTSAFRALDERVASVRARLDGPRAARSARLRIAADEVLKLASEEGTHDAEVKRVKTKLEALAAARGLRSKSAEAEVVSGLAGLKGRLKASTQVDAAFAEVDAALRPSPQQAGLRSAALSELRKGFARDASEPALSRFDPVGERRLARDATAAVVRLQAEIRKLGADPARASERQSLDKQLALQKLFAAEDPGARLALLHEKIAEAESAHDAAVRNARLALETEPGAPPEISLWRDEARSIMSSLSSTDPLFLTAARHAKAVENYYASVRDVALAQDAITLAIRKADAVDALIKARGEAVLRAEKNRLELERASAELSAGAKPLTRREVLSRMKRAQDMIETEVKAGGPDWVEHADGLVAAYRDAAHSYAGADGPLYTALRETQESMRDVAYRQGTQTARRGDPVFDENRREVDGPPLARVLFPVLRMTLQALTGRAINPGGAEVGLTRLNAAKLLRGVLRDPGMTPTLKTELIGSFFGSLLWPRGFSGRGMSWVGNEMRNQLFGFYEDPTAVYVNPRTGRVSARFNGQVMEMDIRTLRFWELQKGTDFTMPFRHLAVGGATDLIANKKANFFLFSATIEGKARKILEEQGVRVLGEVAVPPDLKAADVKMVAGDADSFSALKSALAHRDAAAVAVSRSELRASGHEKEVNEYLESIGVPLKEDGFVVNLRDPQAARLSPAARRWIETRPNQKELVNLFCSDTDAINERYREVVGAGLLKPEEIAIIYSDVQYEMANGDAAQIKRRMNLDGLNAGKVKLLIIDSDYVIRGIDLNFKGVRDGFKHGDFAGYNHVSILFEGVDKNTWMQLVQGVGRTASRRVLPNVRRSVTITSVIKIAEREPAFLAMKADPSFQKMLKDSGSADWAELNAYVAESHDAGLQKSYNDLVKKHMRDQWEAVSAQKLQASGFEEFLRASK